MYPDRRGLMPAKRATNKKQANKKESDSLTHRQLGNKIMAIIYNWNIKAVLAGALLLTLCVFALSQRDTQDRIMTSLGVNTSWKELNLLSGEGEEALAKVADDVKNVRINERKVSIPVSLVCEHAFYIEYGVLYSIISSEEMGRIRCVIGSLIVKYIRALIYFLLFLG